MTDLEKQKVAVLRSQGQSYGAIADALHVSVNSVKTFCRRSHLSASKPAESLPENNLTESENRVITTVTETPCKSWRFARASILQGQADLLRERR